MKKYSLMIISGLALITSLLFTSCSKNNDEMPAANSTIYIRNGQFSLPDVEVTASTPVTWVNEDGTKHTVTADDGSFESGDILPGQSFTLVLTEVGVYTYYSKYKTDMKAKLTVKGFR